MNITEEIKKHFNANNGERAIEFNERWVSWQELYAIAAQIEALLQSHHVAQDCAIGLIARNRATHAAAIAGLISQGRPISMIYAFQSPELMAKEIAKLNLVAVLASLDDWSDSVIDAAKISRTLGIALDDVRGAVPVRGLEATDTVAHYRKLAESGIEILSSGTTGAPKRVFHRTPVLFRTLESSPQSRTSVGDEAPDFVFWPFGGIGGIVQMVRPLVLGKPVVLLERFNVPELMRAVRKYQPPVLGLTPTMVRMLFDADIPKEELTSLKMIYGGSGPLDQALQDAFEQKYDIPVIWAMGATEFCGSILSWSLPLKQEFGASKRGSAGRALPGVEIRIVDPETRAVLPIGVQGCLQAKIDSIGPEWIHTTDLAVLDADGFVFFYGRSDGAIIRGGFKVIPERVNEVLRLHPAIAEAAVVGLPDSRLGHVPVAAVQIRPGCAKPTPAQIEAHLREHLTAPQMPTQYLIVEQLPYTASLKVDLVAVKKLFQAQAVA